LLLAYWHHSDHWDGSFDKDAGSLAGGAISLTKGKHGIAGYRPIDVHLVATEKASKTAFWDLTDSDVCPVGEISGRTEE
jgi:hypothetical protein